MTRKYFGTDGVRGRVGDTPITPDFVMRLGYAAGRVLASTTQTNLVRPTVLIGKDTRVSGYMLESALEAGLIAAGVDVLLVGPMPTPGVAYLTRTLRLQAGIVISASHNPYEDNGIKFFSGMGEKLLDATELAIEAQMDLPMSCQPSHLLGKARRMEDAAGRYIEFCKSTFPSDMNLRGLKIVVDCANGAGYHVAPPVLHELGAEVIAIANKPDGMNINFECGATHVQTLQAAVLAENADIGIALDGDGDRLVMVDKDGKIADGDRLLYIIAKQRQALGTLKGGVVGTLMTNLGVEHALEKLAIPFKRAKVGDRYVLEVLQQEGWEIGGENSGHILCLDQHSTGDAIISALQVLQIIRNKANPSLFGASQELNMYPQHLINVRVNKNFVMEDYPEIAAAAEHAKQILQGRGRVLLRPSGTEPLLRVMVEGEDAVLTLACAEKIAQLVRSLSAKK